MTDLTGALIEVREVLHELILVTGADNAFGEVEALAKLDAILAAVPEKLGAGIKNAVKPNYGVHAECPKCRHKFIQDNGEWLLWCGMESHAQALIDTAALLQQITQE